MFKKSTAVTAAMLASVVVLSGCTGTDAGTGQTDNSSITVAAAIGIPQLNPVIRTFAWEEVLFPLLWDGLTKTSQSGEIEPNLATSWETSDDQLTWTFELRDDVSFSNGKSFTADDVVATFDYYLADGTATQERNKIDAINDVVAVDADTVEITLSSPIATLPAGIVWVKMIDVETLENIDKEPIGTGPYTVSAFTPDSSLTLVRREDYWGDLASIKTITIEKAAESTAAVTGLRSGDIDVLWSVPPGDVEQFETDDAITLVLPASPSQWPFWEMDTTSAPFDNPKVRQALAYSVDREAILEAAYYGQGVVSPTNNALSENNRWFADGLTDYSYDLGKAKALFEEAGVTELTWWGIAGQYPEWNTSGEILQASLAEIGVALDIQNNDVGTWVEKFYPAGKTYPGLIVPNFSSTPEEPAYSLNFYLEGRCECNWSNSSFQSGFAAAIAEPDETLRKEKWAEVQTVINDEVPIIVPLQSTVVTATQKRVQGAWVESGGQLHLESAYVTE